MNLKKLKDKKNKNLMGSAKGVETLYRNAYRAELDLIALATTKSNIMISINGVIVSALIISGGFIDVSKPLLLGPATIFLFTSAISIYFALLAASPDMTPAHSKLIDWVKGVFHIGSYEKRIIPDSNILIYEDRAKLSKPEYLEQMRSLVTNQEQVYETMSDQLYWLGEMANRKFKMLKASYSILRWGIIFSVIAFSGIKLMEYLASPASASGRVTPSPSLTSLVQSVSSNSAPVASYKKFSGIYEPSAAQQLLDGSLLVLEDESARALNIVNLNNDGSTLENDQQDKRLVKSFKREISDLEGVAIDNTGSVYGTTSFSLTKKGKRNPAREQLLRFKIEDGQLMSGGAYMDFGNLLRTTNIFENLHRDNGGRAVSLDDMNIEALSFDADKRQLLFGFREPLIDGKSMVVRMNNPQQVFDTGEQPQLSEDISLLDLNGGGIRSLSYDTHLGAYLIANEVKDASGKWQPQLWLWDGDSDQRPQLLDIAAIKKMKNIEAITSVTIDGVAKIMLLSDDGNRNKKRPAHYLILDYDQIVTI